MIEKNINTIKKLAIYDKNLKKKLEYKKRIDKAIEVLERHTRYSTKELLDILKGDTNGSN